MPYTERFRLTPTIALAVLGSLAFVALAVFVPMPLIIRVPAVTVFGLYAAFSLAVVLSHKIALRVDETGVMLGGLPPRFSPWQDIEAIMLWQRYVPFTIGRWTPFSLGPIRYIGLRRKPTAPPVTPGGRSLADRPAYMAPAQGIAAGAARNITAYSPDCERLAEAVAALAPTVVIERGPDVRGPVRSHRHEERALRGPVGRPDTRSRHQRDRTR